jgi:probable HAF family extracellular repeat protein
MTSTMASMFNVKVFRPAILAAVGSLSAAAGSVRAQPASFCAPGLVCATEWSDGSVTDLGLGEAYSINDAGQLVGTSGLYRATEWSGGSIIDLVGLPGSGGSVVQSINDAGQVVGYSVFVDGHEPATEWSGGSVIDLGGLPGSTNSYAYSINGAGQVVGTSAGVGGTQYSGDHATEWSGGSIIELGGLPGSTINIAFSINAAGQAAGYSCGPVVSAVCCRRVEWRLRHRPGGPAGQRV